MNQSQPEKAERIEEFAKLAHSVKCRIEQQKTPNEEGANKALQILIDTHHQELQKAREERTDKLYGEGYYNGVMYERERIEAIFKEHVPPHAMDLEDSVWLKRLLNKAFNHDKNI